MSLTSSVLEFLRSSYNEENCEYLKKRSNDTLRNNLQKAIEYEEKLIEQLTSYTHTLSLILNNLFRNGRSKYNYIVDGVDFISHVRTKTNCPDGLYDILLELYTIEGQIAEINKELSSRLIFAEIDVDVIMDEYESDLSFKKSPKLLSLIPRKKKKRVLDTDDNAAMPLET